MAILKFILDRLKERSTWLGITALASTVGVALSPEQAAAIAAAGVSVASAIAMFTKG